MAKNDSIYTLERKIKLLTGARKFIKNKECDYICVAISKSVDYRWNYYIENQISWELRDYISKELRNDLTLNCWMSRRRKYNSFKQTPESMRKYRLQWIDWMLSCLREDLASKTTSTRSKASQLLLQES
jgi:hypothetical protein